MEIVILEDSSQVARKAADIVETGVRRGENLGVATGSTPVSTYHELIRRHREEGLSFADCQAFLLDEYIGLTPGHMQSYRAVIRREFTQHVDIDDDKVHGPDGSAEDLQAAGEAYEHQLVAAGGIGVQVLGVGTDGHIGFNEPGSSLVSRTRIKTLHPQTVRDNARFFGSEAEVPIHVLTQGLGTITEAQHLVLLATGQAKAEAVASLVEGPLAAVCPASVLQWHRHATVICDEAAAVQLKHHEYYRAALAAKPAWQSH